MPNYRRIVRYFFLLFLLVGLSACNRLATTQPSIQPPQFSKVPATITTFPTYTASPTQTGRPTFIPYLTNTPTVIPPTDTPTATAQTKPTQLPELALKQTQISSFSATCESDSYHALLSPKGNLLALSCGYKRDQALQVYSKTGKKWVVQFKDYVAKEFIQDGQTPMGTLYPAHWTNDEMYLYFLSAIGFSGGGTCFYGGSGQGLYRLNIENGAVSATLPPLKGPDQYIISFSPDGRWLAYNTGVPTIFNLQTGETIILQEEKNEVGDFAWSPDSSNLAYATCQLSEDYDTSKQSRVRVFSMETRKSKTLLETESGFLRIDEREDNRLKIHDEYAMDFRYSYLDLSTGQLSTLTPTRTPKP